MAIMEFASKLRWVLILLAGIIFLILVGWGLFTIASNIFRSGTDDSSSVMQVAGDVDEDLEFASTVSFEQSGPIVANSEHRSYVITVSSNVVTMRVYASYGQEIIREKSYQNTQAAFESFLLGLDTIGVPDRFEGTSVEDDDAYVGTCPSGRRYIVRVDNSITRWSTSCSDGLGTAGFNMNQTRSLFQRQVPDYSDLIRGVRI